MPGVQGYERPRIRRVEGRVIEIEHLDLTDTPVTRLTTATTAGSTTSLSVEDNAGFGDPHFVLIRPLGVNRAEFGDITGITGVGTITVNVAVGFNHPAGTELRRVLFNQWIVYGNSTNSSTGVTTIATIAMTPGQAFTTYVNTGTQFAFYFVRPYDSIDAVTGENYSDGVSSTTSYASNSVQKLIESALLYSRTKMGGDITFDLLLRELNKGMDYIRGKLKKWSTLQTFDAVLGQTTRGTYSFTLPTDIYDDNSIRSILDVRVGGGISLIYKDKKEFEEKLEDVNRTQTRTATAVRDTFLDIDNSYDFNDGGGVGRGLVGYWKFNENTGTTAFDSTTNNNNGAITGATYVTGQSGQALDFDGVDDIVTVTDASDIQNIFDDGGAISFWINPDTDGEGDAGRILEKDSVWDVQVDSQSGSNVQIAFAYSFSGVNGLWSTAVNIPIDAWTHVVIVYNNGAVTNDPIIYINGTSVTVTEDATPVGTRVTDVGSNLIIGNTVATNRTFDGTIDEVRLYNRNLSASEVTTLYNNSGGGSNSVGIFLNGIKHSITYTDVFPSATVGVLMGVPYSGTGSISEVFAVDSNVWQNEEEGEPLYYTVYDGSLYLNPLPNGSFDDKNVYLDYYTGVVVVDSPSDTIEFPRYDALQHWLTFRLRSLKNDGGRMNLKDADFLMFDDIVKEMIWKELQGGQRFRKTPKKFILT